MMDEKPISSVLAALFLVVCAAIVLTVPSWSPLVSRWAERFDRWGEEPKPMPTMSVPPLSMQAGCPPWNPLLSETVVVFIDVDERGVETARCVRVRERSAVRPRVRL